MIVPMKKVFILVMDNEKDTALEEIRELGTVHLEKKTASSPTLLKYMERNTQIDTVQRVLDSLIKDKKQNIIPIMYDGDIVDYVLSLVNKQKDIQDTILQLHRDIEGLKRWGDFDPIQYNEIKENGIEAFFYELTQNVYDELPEDIPVVVLKKDLKRRIIQFVSIEKLPNIPHLIVPEESNAVVNAKLIEKQNEMSKINNELLGLCHYRNELEILKKSILSDIEFETAKASMELIDGEEANDKNDFPISWISGYIPASELEPLKNKAIEKGWAFSADDPAEDDIAVPTELKNNKLVSIVYPLTNFLEITPGYRESDISVYFLIFITLFFGIIFGDAGYGSLISLTAIFFIIKNLKNGVPAFFKFLFLMGASTTIWGALSGSWFGLEISSLPLFLQNISLPLVTGPSEVDGWIETYNANNYWISSGLVKPFANFDIANALNVSNLITFCFSIAFVHLGLARIKMFFTNIKSLKVLAEIGSMGILVGMYFVALSMVVKKLGFAGVEPWQLYSVFGGFALVFIFANYEGNILKSIMASFANIISVLLGVVNVFTDIMSYIRLWAVAVAGASLALTVNNFASPMLSSMILFVFGMILFVFGHAFNMTLNILAVLVHGVRLNTLEFSGNIGLTWSGFKYKPFVKR